MYIIVNLGFLVRASYMGVDKGVLGDVLKHYAEPNRNV